MKAIRKQFVVLQALLLVVLSSIPVHATSQADMELAMVPVQSVLNVVSFIAFLAGIFIFVIGIMVTGKDANAKESFMSWLPLIVIVTLLVAVGPQLGYVLFF